MKPIFRSKGFYNSRIIATAPLVYFPMDEVSGSVAKNWGSLGAAANGAYTGVDLHSVSGPKGGGVPYFDGTNDKLNIYTEALVSAFNGNEGTILLWGKMFDASPWTDGLYHNFCFFSPNGSTDYITLSKPINNNSVYFCRKANNVLQSVSYSPVTSLDWMQIGMTYSMINDEFKAYFNGAQAGNTQTGLDSFMGTLYINYCCIGAQTATPAAVWNGWIGQAAIWDRVLTPAEIASLA